MITDDTIKEILAGAEKVEAGHYLRGMSVRRKKTLARLFLLASSGVPTVSLSIRHDVAMLLINILLHDLAARDGKISYDPCLILDSALRRAQRAAAGARLQPSRWAVRLTDGRRRWWWVPRELVTLDTTLAHLELAPDDCESVRPYPCAKLRAAGQGGGDKGCAGGGTPGNAAWRAGEDSTHL